MNVAEQQVIASVLDQLKSAKSDPLRAKVIIEQVEQEVLKLHSGVAAELGPWKTLRVPNLPTLGISGSATAISTTGRAQWPQRCLVTACYGCIVGNPWGSGLGPTSVGFQILTNAGDKSLVVNGEGADFMLFEAAFGPNQNWFPIGMEVSGTDTSWAVNFRNLDGANTYTPEFYFRYLPLPPKQ